MELILKIDLTSGAPRHRQVYDAIRASILEGRLRPGDRLPATRFLSQQLALSRTTVAEAYDQLQAEGYIHGRHGSGTYVASNLPEEGLPTLTSRRNAGQRAQRVARLSGWGRRVEGEEYDVLFRPGDQRVFDYDLRPHRVAQDTFPWEAWSAAVERALGMQHDKLLAYPPSAGHPDLLEAIAAHVARYRAVACSPDQIVVVNGTLQGLNLLAQLLLEAGERVAVEDPGYPSARLAFEARRLEVTRVPVDGDGMLVDRLTASCTGSAREAHRLVHVTPSHQDPTGATLSLGRRLALLEVAERYGCLIVEDDYDSEFRYEGRPVESLQGLDSQGLVVYAGTFSKSVLSGLRIGFVVLPQHLVRPFVAARSLWDSGSPMLEQAALAEFMRSGDFERHIRRMRRLYRARRDALVNSLSITFGERVTIGERQGGLNILISLDLPLGEEAIVNRAAHASVGVRGASSYYSVRPDRPTLLLGFAAMPETQIEQAIWTLAHAIGVDAPA
jgi:GntR family transcriptional regulator/MocR family aminotransferase